MKLNFKRLSNRARAPVGAVAFSESYDLFLAQELELKITIDIALKIRQKCYG